MQRTQQLSRPDSALLARPGWDEPTRPLLRDVICLIGWILLACIACQSLSTGLTIRRWAWDQSQPWRFEGDIRNAYSKGTLALSPGNGYLNLYARFRQQPRLGSFFNLDYPPLRLLIVTQWVAWTRQHFLNAHDWQPTYAFNAPLLKINAAFGVAGFFAMWMLVALWVRRSRTPPPPRKRPDDPPGRWWAVRADWLSDPGTLLAGTVGLIAAELFWFDPALVWDAHVWPQWDIWPLPFYLFAILAASLDGWWIAGLLLAVGALLKGQLLLVAPVMILWPAFAGRPWAACRIAVGLAFGVLAYDSPWLLRTSDEQVWHLSWYSLAWVISAFTAAALIQPRFTLLRRHIKWRIAAIASAAGLLAWAFVARPEAINTWAIGSLAVLYALVASLPPKLAPRWGLWLSAALVAALAICPCFGGSMDWWNVGFERGTVQYMFMHAGNTLNLAAILQRFGWRSPREGALLLGGQMLQLRTVLICVYCAGLLACAIGAAIHYRRRDSRVLISLVTPWILMYATLAQMHDRYLVFAAGLTAVAAGVGVGLTLVHLIITALAWASVLASVNGGNPPWLRDTLAAIYPDAAWLTLMCAAIFLWISIAPNRHRHPPL